MRLLSRLAVVIFILAGCGEGNAVPVDPRERHAEDLLSRYVAIDTSRGEYGRAVELLAQELRANGIEPQILTPAGAEFPIVHARLRAPGATQRGALVLMHHMDVVSADPNEWSVAPFSGERKAGYLWGRGAIDAKSLGIAHLEAFVDLQRSRAHLTRDVVFLAVPDEERGGRRGVEALLAARPDLVGAGDVLLGEGGSTDTRVDRVAAWGVEVAQKVPLWLRIGVRGRGGHGATSGASASETLIDVLADLRRQLPLRRELEPDVAAMIRARAPLYRGPRVPVLSHPEQHWESGRLFEMTGGAERSVLSDSMRITTLRAGSAVNVVPTEAFAEIDLRLLRSTDIEALVGRTREIAGDRATVEIVLRGTAAPSSPVDHPFFEVLRDRLRQAEPGSVVVPSVSPATTDSRYFRARGIPSYGLSPFKVNFYDAGGVHGVDERIRTRFFHEGVRLMRGIVRAYCVEE